MVRPESVRLSRDDAGIGTVIAREFFGHDQLLTVTLADGTRIRSRLGPTTAVGVGDRVTVEVERVTSFPT
jgi:hypothetical protein